MFMQMVICEFQMQVLLYGGPLDGVEFECEAEIDDLFFSDMSGNQYLYATEREYFTDEQDAKRGAGDSLVRVDLRCKTDEGAIKEFLSEFV